MLNKLKRWIGGRADAPRTSHSRLPNGNAKLENTSVSYQHAANLLSHKFQDTELTVQEAAVIIAKMQPKRYARGETIIEEGDTGSKNDFMFLVLDGEVAVESALVYRDNTLTVTVFGPGTLAGEMSLVSNQPRSATCVATTPVAAALLHRAGFNELLVEDPAVAAKLLMLISCRISDNLRQTSDKIKLYSRLVETLQTELDGLLPTPKHVQTNHMDAPNSGGMYSEPRHNLGKKRENQKAEAAHPGKPNSADSASGFDV